MTTLEQQAVAHVSAERARELLSYEPETGILRWRVARSQKVPGDIAGSLDRGGYVVVRIDRRTYQAHRIIWLIVTGKLPAQHIDHADRNRANNRLSNLREATPSQNCANSVFKSRHGVKGVCFIKGRSKPWQTYIGANGRRIFLGNFSTKEEAARAYQAAAEKYHGEYACTYSRLEHRAQESAQ